MVRLRDPARALRLAVRAGDDAKVAALVDWLLKTVPLAWPGDDKAPLISMSVIRREVDASSDGFAFRIDESNGIVRAIFRQDEVPQLGVGDRIVKINEREHDFEQSLDKVVLPESLATLGVWKRNAMRAARFRLARDCINDALLEVAQSRGEEAVACRMAERLLAARANIRHSDESRLSALHWAAYLGKLALCELLLERGAPIEGNAGSPAKHTPLQLSVIGGHGAVLRALLCAKADPFATCSGGRQLIHLAALGPCTDLVEMLVDPSAQSGGRQNLDALSEHGWSALFLAAADDNLGMVKSFLALGAPLGQVLRGRPLLHHAAACGSAAVVRWLGAECAAQLPIDGPDPKGRTPLMLAARHSQLGAVEALLHLGASPAIDAHLILGDSGVADEVRLMIGTATRQWRKSRSELLLLAAAAGDVRAMRALHLEQGADLLHADERGYTPMHHAASGGHEDALLYLLQTVEGARLAEASTSEFGSRADWKAEQLAANGRVRTVLCDFARGGEERSRVLLYAKRKLAPYLQQDRHAAAAQAAATLAAQAAAAEEIAAPFADKNANAAPEPPEPTSEPVM